MPAVFIQASRFFCCQILLLVIFYWPFLSGRSSWFYEDITHFFQPLCSFIGQSIRQGHLPLWNPYNYCGMSQAAISSPGIFYPPNWLFALMDFGQCLSVIMILSQAIAGVGTFLLVSSFAWGELAAITGGIAVAFSGYMFSLSNNYTMVAAASWFPLLLWSANMLRKSEGARRNIFTVLCAVFVGFLVNAGRPEIWLPGMISFFVYAAFLVGSVSKIERADLSLAFLKATIIGGLFSLPSILPALEWAPLSRRSEGLATAEILMFSASWYDLLSVFVSQSLGELQLRHSELRALIQPKNIGPYFSSAFISSAIGAMAIIGLQRGGKALFRITCFATLLFFALSLGANLPYSESVVSYLPGFSLLRFPSKLLFFACFGVSLLAARGVKNYQLDGIRTVVPEVLCALLICGSLMLSLSDVLILPFLKEHSLSLSAQLNAQRMIASVSLNYFALSLGLMVVLRFFSKINRAHFGAVLACSLSLAAMLNHAWSFCRYEAPADFFKSPSSLAALIKKDFSTDSTFPRIAPLFMQKFTVPPAYDAAERLESSIRSYQYSRQVLRPFSNIDARVPEMLGFEGAMVGEYFYLCLNAYARSSQFVPISPADIEEQANQSDLPLARIMQLSATPIVVTQAWRDIAEQLKHSPVPTLNETFFEKITDDEQLNLRLYRVRNALPRAYLSYNWRTVASREELISAIYNAEKSLWDPNDCSLLEAPIAPPKKKPTPPEAIRLREDIPELLQAKVNAKAACIFVLADQFYPGWTATVDGVASPLLRVNGFMRGVALEAGEHEVKFEYDPDSVKYSLMLFAIACIWSALLIWKSIEKEISSTERGTRL